MSLRIGTIVRRMRQHTETLKRQSLAGRLYQIGWKFDKTLLINYIPVGWREGGPPLPPPAVNLSTVFARIGANLIILHSELQIVSFNQSITCINKLWV